MKCSLAPFYLAIAAAFAVSTAAAAAQAPAPPPPPVAHASNFGAPRADVLDDGSVVISFEASGELKGLVTLTLHPGDGSSYAGAWAFTVAHADNTNPATGEDSELEPHSDAPGDSGDEPAHQAFLTLIHQGSLSGAVSSAVVSFDADGTLNDLAATLTIDQGALEFSGVTGSGQATLGGVNLIF